MDQAHGISFLLDADSASSSTPSSPLNGQGDVTVLRNFANVHEESNGHLDELNGHLEDEELASQEVEQVLSQGTGQEDTKMLVEEIQQQWELARHMTVNTNGLTQANLRKYRAFFASV